MPGTCHVTKVTCSKNRAYKLLSTPFKILFRLIPHIFRRFKNSQIYKISLTGCISTKRQQDRPVGFGAVGSEDTAELGLHITTWTPNPNALTFVTTALLKVVMDWRRSVVDARSNHFSTVLVPNFLVHVGNHLWGQPETGDKFILPLVD